jgi:hypothetical protein
MTRTREKCELANSPHPPRENIQMDLVLHYHGGPQCLGSLPIALMFNDEAQKGTSHCRLSDRQCSRSRVPAASPQDLRR